MFFFFFYKVKSDSLRTTARAPHPPLFPHYSQTPSLLFRFGVVLQEVGCEPLHGVLWPRFHQSCQTVYQQGDHSALQILPNGQGLERELVGDLHRRGLRGGALRPTRTKRKKEKSSVSADGKGCVREGTEGGVAYLVVRVLLRLWGLARRRWGGLRCLRRHDRCLRLHGLLGHLCSRFFCHLLPLLPLSKRLLARPLPPLK